MIILSTASQEIRVKLGGVPSGSPPLECHCYVSYRSTSDTSYEFGNNATESDSTNEVTLLAGNSVGSFIRAVDHISIYNPDSGAATVTVSFYDGSNSFVLVKQVLNQNETLTYNDKEGWKIL